jgi:hypothetical protein
MTTEQKTSILTQPVAVWAIAFASAVSFMGIGLVDPILPAISAELDATPSQTMLLFTSYLLITAVAMFFTGFISSRLGVKRTMLAGLALIVVFATLAGRVRDGGADHRLPRRLGARQCAVHLDGAGGHRRGGQWRQRAGGDPLRSGARRRHGSGPAAGRSAR